ncbi:MAG: transcription termination/antitermination protein NusA [Bdellovibrionaceae bacterium]|nr:transcription termination/antitermination protein NusA [Pseudobdellovibrionaceae bacterium]
MNSSELAKVIETVGRDRGIKREIIIGALEQAILTAAQKKYGMNAVLEAHFNDDSGEIDLFLFKKVVDSDDSMLEESEEIKIEDAREMDPDAQIGDELGIKVEAPSFGRIDAQTAKQVIFQRVRDAEREIIYNEYLERKGDIITGIARRIERGNLVIDLGKTDALLPRSEIIPGEQFRPGDRVQAYLTNVELTNRGPQIYLSRTTPDYLVRLFEMEVPEIRDEIIEVKGCAREAGARAKIAVFSKERDVDPVGACVGMKGVRVQAVIQELRGEKIDIVPWSDNPMIFVRSALSPAEISSIRIDEENHTMEVMVEDDQLSLAIGRKGQNVRLAAQLTGWKLDIVSKTTLQQRTEESVFNLQHIEGVNETLAHAIYQSGFVNIRQVAEAEPSQLQVIAGFETLEAAEKLKNQAMEVVEKAGDLLAGENKEGKTATEAHYQNQAASDAKSQAEERLREMMKNAESSDTDEKTEA